MWTDASRLAGLAAAAAVVLATTAGAYARPDARSMTCSQVRSLIRAEGAVVMTTGRHTYDRFVSTRGACLRPEIPWQTTVATRDGQCPVYHCVNESLVMPDFFERMR